MLMETVNLRCIFSHVSRLLRDIFHKHRMICALLSILVVLLCHQEFRDCAKRHDDGRFQLRLRIGSAIIRERIGLTIRQRKSGGETTRLFRAGVDRPIDLPRQIIRASRSASTTRPNVPFRGMSYATDVKS